VNVLEVNALGSLDTHVVGACLLRVVNHTNIHMAHHDTFSHQFTSN